MGQHAGTVKQPDFELKVDGRQRPGISPECPIWVNESGWTEGKAALDRDISKWLVETGYGVLLAIETKFNPRTGSRVAGYVIFHSNNGTRTVRKVCIFLSNLIAVSDCPSQSFLRRRILPTIRLLTRGKISSGMP